MMVACQKQETRSLKKLAVRPHLETTIWRFINVNAFAHPAFSPRSAEKEKYVGKVVFDPVGRNLENLNYGFGPTGIRPIL